MSRIGNRILTIPAGVEVNVDGNKITVKGPKGELSLTLNPNIEVKVEEKTVDKPDTPKQTMPLGLKNTVKANATHKHPIASKKYLLTKSFLSIFSSIVSILFLLKFLIKLNISITSLTKH